MAYTDGQTTLSSIAVPREDDFGKEEHGDHHMTAAYANFKKRICSDYLVADDVKNVAGVERKMGLVPGNTNARSMYGLQLLATCLSPLCCVSLVWYKSRNIFVVKKNHFAMVEERRGDTPHTRLFGPGYHRLGGFTNLLGIYSLAERHANGLIVSPVGDLTVAIVEQGTVIHFAMGGQNVLLGPGLHLIRDPLKFMKLITLDSFYIEIGPEKWVTIPDGYDGIAVNLGQMRVLSGGKQHHLAHIGDQFVKMVPKTLLTDRIPTDIPGYIDRLVNHSHAATRAVSDQAEYLETTTSEGSSVILDAMVFWRIFDTDKASRNAMEILVIDTDLATAQHDSADAHIRAASHNIVQLRQTILRIVKNHLTAAVGSISLAGNTSLGTKVQNEDEGEDTEEQPLIHSRTPQRQDDTNHSFEMLKYLQERQNPIAAKCNRELALIGVRVENICIYSVSPSEAIKQELNRQTKARVDANTAVIEARARKQAIEIETEMENARLLSETKSRMAAEQLEAKSQAQANRVKAEAEAEAIERIARARKTEAEELNAGGIASELARIRALGEAGELIFKGDSNQFVYGQSPGDMIYSLFDKVSGPHALKRTFSCSSLK